MNTRTDTGRHEPRHGRLPALVSFLMLAAVFSPVAENWRDNPSDGFPLSYYPMFSTQRGEVYRQTYLVGVDAENNRILIPYRFAGSGGLNQVRRQINKMVRDGYVGELCRSVASRVSRRTSVPFNSVVKIQVVTGTYRLADYFGLRRDTPEVERIRVECTVGRQEQ